MSSVVSSDLMTKLKAFSITHIISIVALVAEGIGFVDLLKSELASANTTNFGWLSIVFIAAIAGTSYYAVNFAANASGITVQTQPAVPSAATPLGSMAQTTPEIQQLIAAVNQLVAQKTPTQTQQTTTTTG